MWYYTLLAIIDIGIFLSDNWKELTGAAIASGIGVILGKRIGVKFAVNYIMKTFGIKQESKMELQVAWLIEQERRRGNVWSANISKPYKLNIIRPLLKRSILSRMGRSIARFVRKMVLPFYTNLMIRWKVSSHILMISLELISILCLVIVVYIWYPKE